MLDAFFHIYGNSSEVCMKASKETIATAERKAKRRLENPLTEAQKSE